MVDNQQQRLDSLFHALSDPTRRSMLSDLAKRERTVGELAQPFDISLAAASKHIKVLETAGLVQREICGRIHICRLDPRPMHAGLEWLRWSEQFWNARLDALVAALEAEGASNAASSSERKPR